MSFNCRFTQQLTSLLAETRYVAGTPEKPAFQSVEAHRTLQTCSSRE